MVTFRDVAKRHASYAAGLASTILLAPWPLALTLALGALTAAVRWHQQTPVAFLIATSVSATLMTAMVVSFSAKTWWYADGLPYLNIPLWLLPLHGLAAQWVLDVYYLTTLRDVRRSTLPD